MKLLNILNELRYSGAEVMLKDAYKYMVGNDIEPYILVTGQNKGPYYNILENIGYKIEHIPFSKSPGYFNNLHKYLKNEGFDIVHIQNERAFIWHTLTVYFTNSKIKIVRSYLDCFNYKGYTKIKKYCGRFIARKLCKVMNISIGPSVAMIEKKLFNNDSIIILDWIDLEHFKPVSNEEKMIARDSFGLKFEDFVVCVIGTCNNKKNHKALFNSILRVHKNIPNIKLLHRGSGPDTENEKKYVKSIGIENNIIFVDYVKDVKNLLISADVFITPSKIEGMGNVNIEAMACGIPVILYNVLGMQDLNFENSSKGGFWINPDENELDKPLIKLFNHPDLRKKMGTDAREIIEKYFNISESMQKLINIYQN